LITLQRTVAPTVEPVTLAQAKSQLRVDFADDDLLIGMYIQAAREYAENYTGRAFIQQTWRLSLDNFPYYKDAHINMRNGLFNGAYLHCMAINLPRPKLMSVSSITYLDGTGTPQTLDPSLYVVDTDVEPARIVPKRNTFWPYPQIFQPNAVQVTYVAGYGTDASTVPAQVQIAILMLTAHFYANREATSQGVTVSNVPLSVNALLDTVRLQSFTFSN
jgi:hypothetical protein